jgi:LEA14-like dessication related protein
MATCAARTSCGTCYANTSVCHWCAVDRACHAIGSYYGCALGVGCYQEDCMRKTSEEMPGTPPSLLECLELVMLFAFVLCCAGFCINVGNAFKSAATTNTTRRDERYVSLGDVEDIGGGQRRVRARTEEQVEIEQWSVPVVELSKETALGRGVQCVLQKGCTCLIAVIGVFLVVVLIVYPHAPNYSVCNSELDWSSALNSLSSLTLSADYDIAMSIRNPNIFSIQVDTVAAVFTFEDVSVASANLKSTSSTTFVANLTPSSVTDVVLPLTFQPESIPQAWRMKKQNEKGELKFKASFSITGVAMGFYYFDIEVVDHVVDMSSMGDQSLCAPCNL